MRGCRWLLLILVFISGCFYSFEDRAKNVSIKNISIESPFENRTDRFELPDMLEEALRSKLVGSHAFTLTSKESAEGTLSLKVTGFKREAYTYTREEEVKEYIVHIDCEVTFFDLTKGEEIWTKKITGFGVFEANAVEDEAVREAVEMLVNRIFDSMLSG